MLDSANSVRFMSRNKEELKTLSELSMIQLTLKTLGNSGWVKLSGWSRMMLPASRSYKTEKT
jgi:hypothetical protein